MTECFTELVATDAMEGAGRDWGQVANIYRAMRAEMAQVWQEVVIQAIRSVPDQIPCIVRKPALQLQNAPPNRGVFSTELSTIHNLTRLFTQSESQ